MWDFFKRIWDFFTNKDESLVKRIFLFLVVFFIFFLVDSIFLFSYKYNTFNKIYSIRQIEQIKKDFSENYVMSMGTLTKLNVLEDNILEKENFIVRAFNYLRWITVWSIKIDFWETLSIQWIWLITLFGIIITSLNVKNVKKNVGSILGMIFLVLFMMFIWRIVFNFLNWLFWIESRFFSLWFNSTLNLIFLIMILFFSSKSKGK